MAPAPPAVGPPILELGEITFFAFRSEADAEPELRLHADGRIEQFQQRQWLPGTMSIRADGLVLCAAGGVGGTIGGSDGRPRPSARGLAADWEELGSWTLAGSRARRTLVRADGSRITVKADGELRIAPRDEETGRLGAPIRYGRLEGASRPTLIDTALWMVGLYFGDEQPMCDSE